MAAYQLAILTSLIVALGVAAIATPRRRGRKQAEAGGGTCSECGRSEGAAGPLARGDRISLCGDCAATAVLHIESQTTETWLLWRITLEHLCHLPAEAAGTPGVIRVVDAAAALAGGDPECVRVIARQASRLGEHERAVELLAGLGPVATEEDLIHLAYCSFLAGDTARGLAALDRIDQDELDHMRVIYFHLNRAALTLEHENSPAAIERATADMAAVRAQLERNAHDIPRKELDGLLAAERIGHGRIALARGEWAPAIDNLRQAIERYDDRRPFIYLLLGDAHAAAGQRDQAEAAWNQAVEQSSPASHHGKQARARLAATPYR